MSVLNQSSVITMSKNAQTVLCKRYLLPVLGQQCEYCDKSHETVEQMFQRVSFGEQAFYDIMVKLDFLPNSPTLMNAGTGAGTLSACFKFDVSDSMLNKGGIMDVARKAAAVQKFGGGVGYVFSQIRPKGTPISTTHGKACGPVAVMRHMHSIAEMITQGGKREGAQMGILHVEHPDIHDFIHCKDENPDALNTFNISVAIPDSFMEKALQDPDSTEAAFLWEMAESAWKTGDPGVFFIDAAERQNPTPHLGSLTGTNPCGEVPLLDNEPCNLGSINLTNFVVQDRGDAYIDWNRLKEVTRTAVRFLDTILDNNTFPDEDITNAAFATRKLGLGVMGWADMLALLHIPYDSDEAVELGGLVMRTIQGAAHSESQALGQEKGVYPGYNSLYSDSLMRNATVTCIAPTGTISIIAGTSSGIEPHFALENERKMGDGTILMERVPVMDRLNGFRPKTAMQIEHAWHIKHQAAFQKYTDLATSKTINLHETATVKNIFDSYIMMWTEGCKGGTIFRDKSRQGVLTEVVEERYPEERPRILRGGDSVKVRTGHGNMYVDINYKEGQPFEVFSHLGKAGGCDSAQIEAISRLISLAYRSGIQTEDIAKQLTGLTCCPVWDEGHQVRSVPDGIALALVEATGQSQAIPQSSVESTPVGPVIARNGHQCPECGGALAHQEGCVSCPSCGWEKC